MNKDNKKTNYSVIVFSISSIIVVIMLILLLVVGYDIFEYFKNFKIYHNNFHSTTFYQKFEYIITNGLLRLLILPFPNLIVPYIATLFMVLTISSTSVITYWYLNTNFIKQIIKSNNIAMISSVIYAVIGFIFKDNYEIILFFPLLLLMIERFIINDTRFIVTVIIFICFLLQYNLFIEQVIICTIYFIIRVLVFDKNRNIKIKIKKIALFLLEIMLGVLLAGCFLYPNFNMSNNSLLETIPTIKDEDGEDVNLDSYLYGFNSQFSTDRVQTLNINLPYRTDVSVIINDKAVELIDFDNSSFKILSNIGVNEIEVNYLPIGFMFGLRLSSIGFIFFVFYIYATLRVVKIIEYNTNPKPRKMGNLIDLKDMSQEDLNKFAMDENSKNSKNDE